MADAVAFEPVSNPKFPANRENNREFFEFKPGAQYKAYKPNVSGPFQQNPLFNGTGNFFNETGNYSQGTGKRRVRKQRAY